MGTRAYKMMKFSSITSLAASPRLFVCLFVFFKAGAGGPKQNLSAGRPNISIAGM